MIDEMEEYSNRLKSAIRLKCKRCSGMNPRCKCNQRYEYKLAAYEACIPRDFWDVKAEEITHNIEIFQRVVLKYIEKSGTALRKGYGLLFLGDNGVGKTFFISFVLAEIIRKGRNAYYTTLPQLDWNIKRGFKDRLVEERLAYMLTSDFLAIDELGKERVKNSNNDYMTSQLERILKQRCDDAMPSLIASNLDYSELRDAYGPTVASIIDGKFQTVAMEPGDYREKLAQGMRDDMGYEA